MVNLLRERAGAKDMPAWLYIDDDDLEAELAAYEYVPINDERPPSRGQGVTS